ncbi:MAG: polyprenyl synthetase family protein, partial [Candidatus Falkowbacteria bacterium]|nr:polyprenyl synthetase family protein [Candidatus Falkowbacteria bacterium]
MNNPNALEYLKTIKPLIWSKILNYLPKKEPFDHYEMVKDYPYRQGKYFRPGLVMLSTEMYGAKKEDALLSAAAVQLSEDWLLIHDDIEDQSEMRRGKPTLNVLHGNELAINAGDALHVIMWKILGENILALGLNYGIKIYNIFNDVLLTTTEGQAIDLTWIHDNKIDITEKEYLDMVKRKTCYYTIIGPVQIGAMIAGQSKDELKKIEEWGLPFGYAFQIWDDC